MDGSSVNNNDESTTSKRSKFAASSFRTIREEPQENFTPFTKDSLQKLENRTADIVRSYGFLPKKKKTIEDGAELPDKYEPFPRRFYGTPLEEVDHFIYDETFCVVSKRFNKNFLHRFTASKSVFLFSPWNPFRRIAVYISTNQYFDYFVMATILVNCVFLAMSQTVEQAEYAFLGIYTGEMLIKTIAKGFILNKYSYLRNPWNWLDFVVISSGYVTMIVSVGNLAGLRTFRVLRALKTVSIMPGLRTIINALLNSIKQLAEVMTLTMFCIMVFALFALQVYKGELRNKCIAIYNNETSGGQDWKSFTWNESNWFMKDGEPLLCGNVSGSRVCPSGYLCIPYVGGNPNFGYTSFDNFFWSMLTTFQLITLDYWENVYNLVVAACGPIHVVFFTIVVFFGSFYLVNLMLAVVAMSYEEEAEITHEERKKDLVDHRDDSTFSFDPERIKNVQKLEKKPKKQTMMTRRFMLLAQYPRKKMKRRGHKGSDKNKNNNNKTSTEETSGGTEEKLSPYGGRLALHRREQEDSPGPSHPSPALIIRSSPTPSSTASPALGQPAVTDSGVVRDQECAIGDGASMEGVMQLPNALEENLEKKPPKGVRRVKCNGLGTTTYDQTEVGYPQVIVIDELIDRNPKCCSRCCLCFTCWLRMQKALCVVVHDPFFDLLIMVCIIVNTIFLSLDHHGMSEEMGKMLRIANLVFTSVFTVESIMKITALSKEYFMNGWNIFDLIVVVGSLIDLGLENLQGLSVLRILRLLRVLKLAQSWTTMKVLLSIIISTLGALGNLTFVLIIVIYMFAVVGMEIFGKDYVPENFEPDPVPRWNFKDFFHAFMMIFRILCGEWIEPLWDCMRAQMSKGYGACFAIFIPALVMGNFMVLNLFLALLLNNFNSEELKNKREEVEEESKLLIGLQRIRNMVQRTKSSIHPPHVRKEEGDKTFELTQKCDNGKQLSIEEAIFQTTVIDEPQSAPPSDDIVRVFRLPSEEGQSMSKTEISEMHPPSEVATVETIETEAESATAEGDSEAPNVAGGGGIAGVKPNWQCLTNYVDELTMGAKVSTQWTKAMETHKRRIEEREAAEAKRGGDFFKGKKVYYCLPNRFYRRFTCWNRLSATTMGTLWLRFRYGVLLIVDNPIFEWVILGMIFASSITLCFEDIYLDEKPLLKTFLYWTNLIFAILFLLEMLLKWVGFGLLKYFSSVWTVLDFFIVVVSLVSLGIEETANLVALRSLRTLRALRPLRAISRWQGMKVVVNALMYAIPSIFNVLLVCLVFWLIFSIMGVQLFGGKFFRCVDENGQMYETHVIGTKDECLHNNYTWENAKISFDHVGLAYLALFQVATFEGWMEVMADAVDARGVDLQPEFESNMYAYIYFVIFIVCGSFFTLNLFIGVIIDNFNMLKKQYEGGFLEMLLTESQKHYYTAMKKLGRKKPRKVIRRPINVVAAIFYDISLSRRFEIAIFALIFLNMVTMGIEHYGQSEGVYFSLELFNALFTTVFGLETVVKILGLRHHYFTIPWNIFDFCLVVASILGLVMEDLMSDFPVSPTLLRVARVFRIGRILRLIRAAKGIRKLLFALVVSLPALFNIGALLALITFIYAILGMSLFGHVESNGALDDMVNFRTFGRSMLLLFRLMTGAGWNDVLDALMIEPPDCDPDYKNLPQGNCGLPVVAIGYFVSFIIICYMIVINMYIAIILENFNEAHQEEEIGIVEDDMEMFYIKWSRYDPQATQFIDFAQLSDFIASLDPPLGIPKPNIVALVSFDLPIAKSDKIHCLDILHSLVKHVLGHVEESDEFTKLQEQMDEKFKKQFPTRKLLDIISSTRTWKREDNAAKVVQNAMRLWLRRKRERERNILMGMDTEDANTQTSSPGHGSIRITGSGVTGMFKDFLTFGRRESMRRRASVSSQRSRSPSKASLGSNYALENGDAPHERPKTLEIPSVLYGLRSTPVLGMAFQQSTLTDDPDEHLDSPVLSPNKEDISLSSESDALNISLTNHSDYTGDLLIGDLSQIMSNSLTGGIIETPSTPDVPDTIWHVTEVSSLASSSSASASETTRLTQTVRANEPPSFLVLPADTSNSLQDIPTPGTLTDRSPTSPQLTGNALRVMMYEDESDLSSQDSRPAAPGLSSSSSDHSGLDGFPAGHEQPIDRNIVQAQVHWEEDEDGRNTSANRDLRDTRFRQKDKHKHS